ncbi:hypothetical protein, partial [Actinophytocola xanthii]
MAVIWVAGIVCLTWTTYELEPHFGRYTPVLWVAAFPLGYVSGLIMLGRRTPPVMIYTVFVDGRMVHYGTDRAEAENLADITGGAVEPTPDWRWYSIF